MISKCLSIVRESVQTDNRVDTASIIARSSSTCTYTCINLYVYIGRLMLACTQCTTFVFHGFCGSVTYHINVPYKCSIQ